MLKRKMLPAVTGTLPPMSIDQDRGNDRPQDPMAHTPRQTVLNVLLSWAYTCYIQGNQCHYSVENVY